MMIINNQMINMSDFNPGFIMVLAILVLAMIVLFILNSYTCYRWLCHKKPILIRRRLVFNSDTDDISIKEFEDHRLMNDRRIYEDDEEDLYYA